MIAITASTTFMRAGPYHLGACLACPYYPPPPSACQCPRVIHPRPDRIYLAFWVFRRRKRPPRLSQSDRTAFFTCPKRLPVNRPLPVIQIPRPAARRAPRFLSAGRELSPRLRRPPASLPPSRARVELELRFDLCSPMTVLWMKISGNALSVESESLSGCFTTELVTLAVGISGVRIRACLLWIPGTRIIT